MNNRGSITSNSPPAASIHILDDDSLLNVFLLYRPDIFDDDDDDRVRVMGGKEWDREQWWYKLTHVCRRWRSLIFGSASYLALCLVCTIGTPVADMLAHSPPLPIIIDYDGGDKGISTRDEEGITLALERRDRVRRIRLWMPGLRLEKLLMAIDGEYPILEYLIVGTPTDAAVLILPKTLQAPHIHHLTLFGFAFPIGLTTIVGLVRLCLYIQYPFTHFQPTVLLQWLSFTPLLETLAIGFSHPVPSPDVERQLMHMPITTHVMLPNLRWFVFRGVSADLEALVDRITAPSLEKLEIYFFEQQTFSVPCLLQFTNTTENLRFVDAKFQFSNDEVVVEVYPREARSCVLSINIFCWHLDWQVSSVAQLSDTLSGKFFTVEHLTLGHEIHSHSSEEHNEVDRSEWRRLLRPFRNVKTLRVDHGLVKDLSRSLRQDDGELPLELLPELQELTFSGSGDVGGAFTSFIDARQNAGRPVTLARSPGRHRHRLLPLRRLLSL